VDKPSSRPVPKPKRCRSVHLARRTAKTHHLVSTPRASRKPRPCHEAHVPAGTGRAPLKGDTMEGAIQRETSLPVIQADKKRPTRKNDERLARSLAPRPSSTSVFPPPLDHEKSADRIGGRFHHLRDRHQYTPPPGSLGPCRTSLRHGASTIEIAPVMPCDIAAASVR